jgi:hypothetical protein
MFQNRTIGIVTKHEKELLISDLLVKELNCKVELIAGIDTDQLGTFTGEIERKELPLETIQKKCILGHQKGYDLVLASEGSFGVHPSIPFMIANEELILLSDKKHTAIFLGKSLSSETNYLYEKINSIEELKEKVLKIGFPSHGVILEFKTSEKSIFLKEITNIDDLIQGFKNEFKDDVSCFIHSDMRAHRNPTRRKTILSATNNLIEQLKSLCPNCNFPGFSTKTHEFGLPCSNCLKPTKSIRKTFTHCKKCTHFITEDYPKNKFFEDPQFCDYCNP